ncbi:MAG TPA: histidine ammonia-lyase [Actinomycetes bacterium]|nr:histidine ammonia-lyase [Actinomycetes bacterium]
MAGAQSGDDRQVASEGRLVVTGDPLTIDDVIAVARGRTGARLDPGVAERMAATRAVVERAVAEDRVMYGITTGFGALANTRIAASDLAAMQLALVRSHAAGVGGPLTDDVVRALLLLRARTLAAGISGVRVDLPERLLLFLERGLLPVVPEQGSVGASGDLAQLAHLALPLVGEGRLRRVGDADLTGRPARELLDAEGISPLELQPKEGLSLINGTEPMQARLALSIDQVRLLVKVADLACAMSLDGLLGTDRAFDARVIDIRPHAGQLRVADNLRRILAGSGLLASHRHDFEHAVQDSYSLRCAPQVHGAVRDVLNHVTSVLTVELGSVVDNPVIVPTADGSDFEVMSTGNFHGEPLAFGGDMLAIAIAELASISERRTDRMLDPAFSRGLPPFLAANAGTNSGYMLAQYTAASLVSENKVLAHPSSVDTIPTSGNQEDHVSMGWTSMRKLRDAVRNVRSVLAVEMLCAAQAIDLRSDVAAPSPAVAAAHALLRDHVPTMLVDREVAPQIEAVDALLPALVDAAEQVAGPLD